MLLKTLKWTIVGVAGLGFSAIALADGHGSSVNLGFKYRAGLTYDDRGITDTQANKDADKDPSSKTNIDLEYAKLTGWGEAAKNVKFGLQYNVKDSALEVAKLTYKHSGFMSIMVGRDQVHQGGYDFDAAGGHMGLVPSNYYNSYVPFDRFTDMIELQFALAGELAIQFMDDITADTVTTSTTDANGDTTTTTTADPDSTTKNEKNRNPAMTLQWSGNFNGWMPQVQIGSYDLNNSTYFGLGVKGKAAGVGVALDYINDSRFGVVRDGNGNRTDTDDKNVHTAISLHLDYALSSWTPFLAFHTYDVKQGDDLAAGGEDLEGNPSGEEYSDNGQSISVGVTCNAMGAGYVPYLTLTQESGDFDDSTEADKQESLTNMKIRVGVAGKF